MFPHIIRMFSLLQQSTHKDVDFFSFKGLRTLGKVLHVYDLNSFFLAFVKEGKIIKVACKLHGITGPEMTKQPDICMKARNRFIQLTTNCNIDLNNQTPSKQLGDLLETNSKIIVVEFKGHEKFNRELVMLYDGETCINSILIHEGWSN